MGVDVSSYQGSGVNWSGVKRGYRRWAKATEGTYRYDADFAINENNGKAPAFYMGAYHFARPDLNSPGSEASYFWSSGGGYIKADGKTLMPTLDLETFNGVVGASSYSAWANSWCDDHRERCQWNGVKVTPVLYYHHLPKPAILTAAWAVDSLGSQSQRRERADRQPLGLYFVSQLRWCYLGIGRLGCLAVWRLEH